jgi:hypothetical protein
MPTLPKLMGLAQTCIHLAPDARNFPVDDFSLMLGHRANQQGIEHCGQDLSNWRGVGDMVKAGRGGLTDLSIVRRKACFPI